MSARSKFWSFVRPPEGVTNDRNRDQNFAIEDDALFSADEFWNHELSSIVQTVETTIVAATTVAAWWVEQHQDINTTIVPLSSQLDSLLELVLIIKLTLLLHGINLGAPN